MTDFFISYTGSDQAWAEWIAYVLEENGFQTIIQAWDFRPGNNFVAAMQDAASKAKRTIMVLSPAYLTSGFAEAEWIAAFAKDPKGLDQKLVPIVIEAVDAPGILSAVVQIRLYGISEDEARDAILTGIDRKRAKPSSRPTFPGSASHPEPKAFPGSAATSVADLGSEPAAARPSLIPTLRLAPTDVDKRRFLRNGFDAVRELFERNAAETVEREPRIQIDLEMRTNADLRGGLFVHGDAKGGCRVWIDDSLGGTSILFAEGTTFAGNGHNEMITVADGGELAFSAIMSMGFSQFEKEHDMKKMSAADVAEYLWQRFVSPLSREAPQPKATHRTTRWRS